VNFDQLRVLCKASPKIFVWVELSEKRAAYLQITKSTLNEYLSSVEFDPSDKAIIEIGEEGELYLGRADVL
jgi:hypothetical protein